MEKYNHSFDNLFLINISCTCMFLDLGRKLFSMIVFSWSWKRNYIIYSIKEAILCITIFKYPNILSLFSDNLIA
jgi:hypothetical protein